MFVSGFPTNPIILAPTLIIFDRFYEKKIDKQKVYFS